MAQGSWLRVLFLALFINAHQHVLRLINTIVPAPYLDEVFHVPQAQRYWKGKWAEWDPKITTPPGVYLWSFIFNTVRTGTSDEVSTEDLRFSNAVLLYVLVLVLTVWNTVARRQVDTSVLLQKEFVIVSFPLLFFFSGLYYTDLFSALTVVLTYVAWEAGLRYDRRQWLFQVLHLVFGLVSLASRQTNVFWVAVFLAGLQIVESIKKRVGAGKLRDPDIGAVWLEDYFHFTITVIQNAIFILPYLLLDLWPQLALLGSFIGFVIWNNGVVLGDKQNHVATIHTPQLLYIWPMIVFFSWPVILTSLAAQLRPPTLSNLRTSLPRFWVTGLILTLMGVSVHFNTIVHPFTLADNRHYTFYVFRILLRHTWVKYAAVPIYYTCAWFVITALGHPGPSTATISPTARETVIRTEEKNNAPLSFVLVWLISTTLSLVSAPLVEPRYFIVPWLMWRLYVPEPSAGGARPEDDVGPGLQQSGMLKKASSQQSTDSVQGKSAPDLVLRIQQFLVSYSLWIELAWYTIINAGTIYIFLHWGFRWNQEPEHVQRFIW